MAVNFNAWLGSPGAPSPLATTVAGQRAIFAWKRISDKKSDIAFKKPDGTTLAAQTVRIEYDNSSSPSESAAGAASKRKAIVFGVKDYPLAASTGERVQPIGLLLALTHTVEAPVGEVVVPDTDIKVGYRFVRENREYRVESVIFSIGEVQAIAEATG